MLSRGYDGTVPPLLVGPGGAVRASVRVWTIAMLPPAAAVLIAVSTWLLR
jgi:cobalt/nickel transport system permease protein